MTEEVKFSHTPVCYATVRSGVIYDNVVTQKSKWDQCIPTSITSSGELSLLCLLITLQVWFTTECAAMIVRLLTCF